jgi:bacteriocin-like protein
MKTQDYLSIEDIITQERFKQMTQAELQKVIGGSFDPKRVYNYLHSADPKEFEFDLRIAVKSMSAVKREIGLRLAIMIETMMKSSVYVKRVVVDPEDRFHLTIFTKEML